MTQMCCRRHGATRTVRTVAIMLQLFVLASILQANDAAAGGESSNANDDPATLPLDNPYGEKRNWQSLQGSWGKRLDGNEPAPLISGVVDDDVLLAEQWMPVLLGNGERGEALAQYPLVYPRLSSTSAAGSAHSDELALNDDDLERSVDDIMNEKRTWKNMNVAWGKRRNAPGWNKFRGAWGKREPGWNNLKGMWGKRSSNNWQKLHAGWGKRAALN